MTVAEFIEALRAMPQDAHFAVEVEDAAGSPVLCSVVGIAERDGFVLPVEGDLLPQT